MDIKIFKYCNIFLKLSFRIDYSFKGGSLSFLNASSEDNEFNDFRKFQDPKE